jgi:type IV pilus assembly protein PilB
VTFPGLPLTPPPGAAARDGRPALALSSLASARQRLGDLLVIEGLVAREVVERTAAEARSSSTRLGEALLAQQLIAEADLYRVLAAQHHLRLASLEELAGQLDLAATEAVSRGFLEREFLLPIARVAGGVLVATCNPLADGGDIAKALSVHQAHMCLVTPTDYRRLWMMIDARRGRPVRAAPEHGDSDGIDLLTSHLHGADSRHVALFETLLLEAISERASDLHLERYGNKVRVRLRVDGDLHSVDRIKLSPQDLVGVINVIKIGANLDIAERRIPQGGRIRRRAGEKIYDLRVQTQPALHGEHVVIRLLPQDTRLLTIEDLGFPPGLAADYRRMLDGPGGLLLVVGPTGSGKSTTLYAGLQHISRDATRKAITIEDPIEYSIDGVQQTQVRTNIGFAFADAMRAFVREDPDVILVGEIRDKETALEAIRASQTGHLVLSTLHCNDAVDAVQRLLDLEMHPNSVASELLAVFAQRLAKRICEGCRVETDPDPAMMGEIFPAGVPADFRCYKGTGCPACSGHGTHGRIAAVELMRSGSAVRRAISRAAALDDLRAVALDTGLVTMRDTALWLVAKGVIPLSELPWILPIERMADERHKGANS